VDLLAVVGEDLHAGRPRVREQRVDTATAAATGDVPTGDAVAERGDLPGVVEDLLEVRRWLLRVQTGLLEQVLVVEEHRGVELVRNGVDLPVRGGDRQV